MILALKEAAFVAASRDFFASRPKAVGKVVSKEVWLQILKPNFRQNGDEKYEKQSEESERSRREKRRREKEKESKKEDTGARNVRKAAKQCVFPVICGSESKVGSGKWRLRRHLGR